MTSMTDPAKPVDVAEPVKNKRLIIEFNGQQWRIVYSDFNVLELKEIAREILEVFSAKIGAS